MKDGSWIVLLCEGNEIKDFIEKWYYFYNINGLMSSYCFKLIYKEEIVGVLIYGKFGMVGVWKKCGSSDSEVLELRRLVLIDDTPKNAESFFIGKTLRWLKQNTQVKRIVSYADPNYGHQGIIYQATNFQKVGVTQKGRVIMWNGKKYHDKAIRTKYKGQLKPFAKKLKAALDNKDAYYVEQSPKFIYLKEIK